MNEQNFASIYVPTRMERFWRALGFRYRLGDEPEGTDGLEGWTHTGVNLHFSFADRLRLLVSGRLHVVIVSTYDAPSPTVIKNRIDWHIRAPSKGASDNGQATKDA